MSTLEIDLEKFYTANARRILHAHKLGNLSASVCTRLMDAELKRLAEISFGRTQPGKSWIDC